MSSKKRRERRTFTEEFKRSAVELVVKEGYSLSGAAKAVMCRVFDVSKSGFYGWLKRPESKRAERTRAIHAAVKEVYERLRSDLRQLQDRRRTEQARPSGNSLPQHGCRCDA